MRRLPFAIAIALMGVVVSCGFVAKPAAAAPPLTHGSARDPLALLAVQQAEFTASDATAYDFGYSVALDGDTALVGAAGQTVNGHLWEGAAYVFVRSGTSWSQQAELSDPNAAEQDVFGRSVARSGDTALIGAEGTRVNGLNYVGSAYIFVRSGASWSEEAELVDPDPQSVENFGWSVALDGGTALIGAVNKSVGGQADAGATYVFTRSGTSWPLQAELTASHAAEDDYLGNSVALSGDTALVGAVGGAGSAYVFTRSGASWSRQAKLTASDAAAGDDFGFSVALSGDTALVGADQHTVSGRGWAGSAYVFTRSGVSWSQRAELTATDVTPGAMFGSSVALSGDRALIGADWNNLGIQAGAGAAYVFGGSGASWSPPAELTATGGALGDEFGVSVALSGDTALVGGSTSRTVGGRGAAEAACVDLLGSLPTAAPSLSLKASARSVKVGRSIVITGVVRNFLATQGMVGIRRTVAGKPPVLRKLTMTTSGTFRWRTKVGKAGRWVFVASYKLGDVTAYTSRPVAVVVHK